MTSDALELIQIVRIALLEAFNPMQGQSIDEPTIMIGAVKILKACETKINAVDLFLGDA